MMGFAAKASRHLILPAVLLGFVLPAVAATKYPLTDRAYDDFVLSPFDFTLGVNREEVLKSLGHSKKENQWTEKNAHVPTLRNVFHEFWYDGRMLRTGLFTAVDPPASGLILVVVTSNIYKLKHQLEVGSSKGDVQRVLGWPAADLKINKWSFSDHQAGYVSLEFTFGNDRVSRIEWASNWD